MESLSFRIPEQHPPGKDAFDIRPTAVQRWVEELPMGHIGESAKQLYEMLREVNRLKLPLADRFALLEMISSPLHAVLESLQRRYTGMSFPLPAKAIRVAQFANGLLSEVVIAYQAVLNSEQNASWLYRMTHTRMWLETVHRLVYYLNMILCNYRLLHRMAPGGVWLALHQLYWTARDNQRQLQKVKSPQGELPTTIEAEYKRALLLSLVEPQLFNREQMAQLQANMPLWLARCELVEAKARPGGMVGYCIRREADAPHTKLTRECCSDCDGEQQAGILLNLDGLSLYLASLLEELGEGEQLKPKGGSTLSRETLETLRGCWRSLDEQRHDRIRRDASLEVAIGMSTIFQLLQGKGDVSAHGISDQHMSDALEELVLQTVYREREVKNEIAVKGGGEKDVWNAFFYATEITQKAWVHEMEEREYRFIPALQRDYTAQGYCLEFDKEKMEPLQVGELIGVKRGAQEPMGLCMVRWLNEEERLLTAGLMRLADSMEPVLVVVHQEGRRSALYCLLGIGEDHKPQLFLPHLPGIRMRQLFLVVDGKEVPLSLHERVVVSPLFDGFHFHASKLAADEEMSLEQVNQKLHALTHPERAERRSDDFSDLWNSL